MTEGSIHSIESMGLLDGPGIRAVVFFQGCRLRCKFCHNPDTWAVHGGERMTPAALADRLARFAPYFDRSGGGVTFSGGDPLMQPAFLLETLQECRQRGLHTCLDTAGVGPKGFDPAPVLALTDLVLYDVKHWDPDAYRALTGLDIAETEAFQKAMTAAGVPLWVRHVVVPEHTDTVESIRALRGYISTHLANVQKVELLPYHLLGAAKYPPLGIPYPLEGVPTMDRDRCLALQKEVFPEYPV